MATGVAELGTALLSDPSRAAAELGPLERRVCRAAVELVGRWGVRKTTIADVAKEAGCGRATIYRAFPGGKQELLLVAGALELSTFLDTMAELADRCDDTESVLVALISTAASEIAGHAAVQYLLHNEPDLLLPLLGWGEQNHLYSHVASIVGPHLEPFLGDRAGWASELAARTVLSYLFNPSPDVDLADEAQARRLVRQFVLPALGPVAVPSC